MTAAADKFNEIATVRIELEGSDPLIWRQVEVPTSVTLQTLHDIIQGTMGWFDCHLWEFTIAECEFRFNPAGASDFKPAGFPI
jgi:hypothetical protein